MGSLAPASVIWRREKMSSALYRWFAANSFAVSLDGYAAGPHQSLEAPLGVRGPELSEWFFSTRTWKQMHGYDGGSTGVNNDWAQRG
jgi:hypothetical protein